MNVMKKFLAIFMAFVLVFSLAACDTDNDVPETTVPDETHVHEEPTTEPTTPNETEPVETEPTHVHEYVSDNTVDATCTEDGYTVYKCHCGDSYKADYVKATNHEWGDWVTVKAPTATSTGQSERYCSVCVQKEVRDEPKLIPDHKHEYTSNLTKQATCTSTGTMTYTCSCGASFTEKIEKTPHNYKSSVTMPTCITSGYTTYTCSACKNTYKDNYTDATGHKYGTEVTAATCIQEGYTTYTCNNCGYFYTDDTTPMTDHTWSEWKTVKEPTATSTGKAERYCTVCSKTESKTLDKVEGNHKHKYDTEETTKEPTCTEDGVKTFMCSCGVTRTEKINALDHDYQETVTAPTCTQNGHTTYTCTRCGDSYTGNETAANGHKWDDGVVTTKPTCTTNGVKTYTCVICKAKKTESIPKTGHNYTAKVTAPTCTADGYTTYTCVNCGNSYKSSPTDALDHSYTESVTAPTCTEQGYTIYACIRCKYQVKKDYTDATGHSYEATVTAPTCTEKGCTTNKCSRCGKSYTSDEVPATGHVNIATETVQPTCTKDGHTTTYCVDCGTPISVTVIPSKGTHSYTTKMNLAIAVQKQYEQGLTHNIEFIQAEDFDVMVCSGCGAIDLDTMTFRYSDYQTSAIMLGYINNFREANGVFHLEIDPGLISQARAMMTNYLRTGFCPDAFGGYKAAIDGGKNIRQHFQKFGGTGNEKFLSYNYEYMAYVVGVPEIRETDIYGILLIK
jgi:DNA-directed RNA polymerase subunit RPC12/RpoP